MDLRLTATAGAPTRTASGRTPYRVTGPGTATITFRLSPGVDNSVGSPISTTTDSTASVTRA